MVSLPCATPYPNAHHLIPIRLWAGSRIGGADGRVVFQDGSEPLSFCDLFEPTGIETTGWHAQLVDDQESSHSSRIWDAVWKGASSDSGVLELSMGRPKDLEQWMALVKIACRIPYTPPVQILLFCEPS